MADETIRVELDIDTKKAISSLKQLEPAIKASTKTLTSSMEKLAVSLDKSLATILKRIETLQKKIGASFKTPIKVEMSINTKDLEKAKAKINAVLGILEAVHNQMQEINNIMSRISSGEKEITIKINTEDVSRFEKMLMDTFEEVRSKADDLTKHLTAAFGNIKIGLDSKSFTDATKAASSGAASPRSSGTRPSRGAGGYNPGARHMAGNIMDIADASNILPALNALNSFIGNVSSSSADVAQTTNLMSELLLMIMDFSRKGANVSEGFAQSFGAGKIREREGAILGNVSGAKENLLPNQRVAEASATILAKLGEALSKIESSVEQFDQELNNKLQSEFNKLMIAANRFKIEDMEVIAGAGIKYKDAVVMASNTFEEGAVALNEIAQDLQATDPKKAEKFTKVIADFFNSFATDEKALIADSQAFSQFKSQLAETFKEVAEANLADDTKNLFKLIEEQFKQAEVVLSSGETSLPADFQAPRERFEEIKQQLSSASDDFSKIQAYKEAITFLTENLPLFNQFNIESAEALTRANQAYETLAKAQDKVNNSLVVSKKALEEARERLNTYNLSAEEADIIFRNLAEAQSVNVSASKSVGESISRLQSVLERISEGISPAEFDLISRIFGEDPKTKIEGAISELSGVQQEAQERIEQIFSFKNAARTIKKDKDLLLQEFVETNNAIQNIFKDLRELEISEALDEGPSQVQKFQELTRVAEEYATVIDRARGIINEVVQRSNVANQAGFDFNFISKEDIATLDKSLNTVRQKVEEVFSGIDPKLELNLENILTGDEARAALEIPVRIANVDEVFKDFKDGFESLSSEVGTLDFGELENKVKNLSLASSALGTEFRKTSAEFKKKKDSLSPKEIEEYSFKLDELGQKSIASQKAAKLLAKQIDLLESIDVAASTDRNTKSLSDNTKEVDKLDKKYKQLAEELQKLQGISSRTNLNTSEFSAAGELSSRAGRQINQLRNRIIDLNAEKIDTEPIKELSNEVQKISSTGEGEEGLPFFKGLINAISDAELAATAIREVNDEMARAKAEGRLTGVEMQSLSERLNRVQSTGKSAARALADQNINLINNGKNYNLTNEEIEKFRKTLAESENNLARQSIGLQNNQQHLKGQKTAYENLAGGVDLYSTKLAESLLRNSVFASSFALIFGAITSVRNALRSVSDINFQAARVVAVTRDITRDNRELANVMGVQIANAARQYGTSLDEAQNILRRFGSAGLTAQQSLAAFESTLQAVIATEGDATQFARSIAGTFSVLGDTVDIAGSRLNALPVINDIAVRAFKESQLELDEYTQGLKFTAAAAKNVGLDIFELTGLLQTLNNNMIKGGTAGRYLQVIFAQIAQKRDQIQDVFGVEVDPDAPLEFLGLLQDVSTQLTTGQISAERLGQVFQLFGLRGARAFLVLAERLNDVNDNIDDLRMNAQDSAEVTAFIKVDTIERQLAILGEMFLEISRLILEPLGGENFERFKEIIKSINDVLDSFANLLQNRVVRVILFITAGIISFNAIIGISTILIGTLSKAFGGLSVSQFLLGRSLPILIAYQKELTLISSLQNQALRTEDAATKQVIAAKIQEAKVRAEAIRQKAAELGIESKLVGMTNLSVGATVRSSVTKAASAAATLKLASAKTALAVATGVATKAGMVFARVWLTVRAAVIATTKSMILFLTNPAFLAMAAITAGVYALSRAFRDQNRELRERQVRFREEAVTAREVATAYERISRSLRAVSARGERAGLSEEELGETVRNLLDEVGDSADAFNSVLLARNEILGRAETIAQLELISSAMIAQQRERAAEASEKALEVQRQSISVLARQIGLEEGAWGRLRARAVDTPRSAELISQITDLAARRSAQGIDIDEIAEEVANAIFSNNEELAGALTQFLIGDESAIDAYVNNLESRMNDAQMAAAWGDGGAEAAIRSLSRELNQVEDALTVIGATQIFRTMNDNVTMLNVNLQEFRRRAGDISNLFDIFGTKAQEAFAFFDNVILLRGAENINQFTSELRRANREVREFEEDILNVRLSDSLNFTPDDMDMTPILIDADLNPNAAIRLSRSIADAVSRGVEVDPSLDNFEEVIRLQRTTFNRFFGAALGDEIRGLGRSINQALSDELPDDVDLGISLDIDFSAGNTTELLTQLNNELRSILGDDLEEVARVSNRILARAAANITNLGEAIELDPDTLARNIEGVQRNFLALGEDVANVYRQQSVIVETLLDNLENTELVSQNLLDQSFRSTNLLEQEFNLRSSSLSLEETLAGIREDILNYNQEILALQEEINEAGDNEQQRQGRIADIQGFIVELLQRARDLQNNITQQRREEIRRQIEVRRSLTEFAKELRDLTSERLGDLSEEFAISRRLADIQSEIRENAIRARLEDANRLDILTDRLSLERELLNLRQQLFAVNRQMLEFQQEELETLVEANFRSNQRAASLVRLRSLFRNLNSVQNEIERSSTLIAASDEISVENTVRQSELRKDLAETLREILALQDELNQNESGFLDFIATRLAAVEQILGLTQNRIDLLSGGIGDMLSQMMDADLTSFIARAASQLEMSDVRLIPDDIVQDLVRSFETIPNIFSDSNDEIEELIRNLIRMNEIQERYEEVRLRLLVQQDEIQRRMFEAAFERGDIDEALGILNNRIGILSSIGEAGALGIAVDELENVLEIIDELTAMRSEDQDLLLSALGFSSEEIDRRLREVQELVTQNLFEIIEAGQNNLSAFEEQVTRISVASTDLERGFIEAFNSLSRNVGEGIDQVIAQFDRLSSEIEDIAGAQIIFSARGATGTVRSGRNPGSLQGFNTGGRVGGSGTGDIVPAMLEPGEFVIRRSAVSKFGAGVFNALNNGDISKAMASVAGIRKFQSGGSVENVRVNTMGGFGGMTLELVLNVFDNELRENTRALEQMTEAIDDSDILGIQLSDLREMNDTNRELSDSLRNLNVGVDIEAVLDEVKFTRNLEQSLANIGRQYQTIFDRVLRDLERRARDFTISLGERLNAVLRRFVIDGLSQAVNNAFDLIQNASGSIFGVWSRLLSRISVDTEDTADGTQDTLADSILELEKQLRRNQISYFDFLNALEDLTVETFDEIKDEIDDALEFARETLRELGNIFAESGRKGPLSQLSGIMVDFLKEEMRRAVGTIMVTTDVRNAKAGREGEMQSSLGLGGFMNQLLGATQSIGPQVSRGLIIGFGSVLALFQTTIGAFLQSANVDFDQITEKFVDIIERLPELLTEFIDQIVENVPVIVEAFVDNLPMIIDALIDGVLQIIPVIADALPEIIEAILRGVLQILERLPEIIEALVHGLIKALPDIIHALIELLPQIATELMHLVMEIPAILIEAIPDIAEAIIKATFSEEFVLAMLRALRDSITRALRSSLRFLLAPFVAIGRTFERLREQFSKVGDIFQRVGQFFKDVVEKLKKVLGAAGSPFRAVGRAARGAWRRVRNIFHEGGYVGDSNSELKNGMDRQLKSDEVSAILQVGEGVLSRKGLQGLGGRMVLDALNSGKTLREMIDTMPRQAFSPADRLPIASLDSENVRPSFNIGDIHLGDTNFEIVVNTGDSRDDDFEDRVRALMLDVISEADSKKDTEILRKLNSIISQQNRRERT